MYRVLRRRPWDCPPVVSVLGKRKMGLEGVVVMAKVSGRVWMVGLLVLGLVVSLLGVAPPEGAVGTHGEEDIDFAPMYSACVGAATESAGFEDTVDIGAEEAIDCLFHYGITTGRS